MREEIVKREGLNSIKECAALHVACEENQPKIVELLLSRNDLDVNQRNNVTSAIPTVQFAHISMLHSM